MPTMCGDISGHNRREKHFLFLLQQRMRARSNVRGVK